MGDEQEDNDVVYPPETSRGLLPSTLGFETLVQDLHAASSREETVLILKEWWNSNCPITEIRANSNLQLSKYPVISVYRWIIGRLVSLRVEDERCVDVSEDAKSRKRIYDEVLSRAATKPDIWIAFCEYAHEESGAGRYVRPEIVHILTQSSKGAPKRRRGPRYGKGIKIFYRNLLLARLVHLLRRETRFTSLESYAKSASSAFSVLSEATGCSVDQIKSAWQSYKDVADEGVVAFDQLKTRFIADVMELVFGWLPKDIRITPTLMRSDG